MSAPRQKQRLCIVGAGDHAHVVADTALETGRFRLVGFADELGARTFDDAFQVPVVHVDETSFQQLAADVIVVAVGNNAVRQRLARALINELGQTLAEAIVHPRAFVSSRATIGRGTVICAGATVNTEASVGENCIVNTGATVDHHCHVSNDVHVAPGAHLAGNVTVGEGTLVGLASCVLPHKTIGAWATVGAGAVVINDVARASTAIGCPAHTRRTAEVASNNEK